MVEMLSHGLDHIDTLSIAWLAHMLTAEDITTFRKHHAVNRIMRYYDGQGAVIEGFEHYQALSCRLNPWPDLKGMVCVPWYSKHADTRRDSIDCDSVDSFYWASDRERDNDSSDSNDSDDEGEDGVVPGDAGSKGGREPGSENDEGKRQGFTDPPEPARGNNPLSASGGASSAP